MLPLYFTKLDAPRVYMLINKRVTIPVQFMKIKTSVFHSSAINNVSVKSEKHLAWQKEKFIRIKICLHISNHWLWGFKNVISLSLN